MKRHIPKIKPILEFTAIWVSLMSYSVILGAIAAPLILLYFIYSDRPTC